MGRVRAAGMLTAVVLVAACSAQPDDRGSTPRTASSTAESSAVTSTALAAGAAAAKEVADEIGMRRLSREAGSLTHE